MDKLVARINELAAKAKHAPLTPAEQNEQQRLRRSYAERVKQNLRQQLDSMKIVDEQGRPRKIKRKE